jgi:hypothetical protein
MLPRFRRWKQSLVIINIHGICVSAFEYSCLHAPDRHYRRSDGGRPLLNHAPVARDPGGAIVGTSGD